MLEKVRNAFGVLNITNDKNRGPTNTEKVDPEDTLGEVNALISPDFSVSQLAEIISDYSHTGMTSDVEFLRDVTFLDLDKIDLSLNQSFDTKKIIDKRDLLLEQASNLEDEIKNLEQSLETLTHRNQEKLLAYMGKRDLDADIGFFSGVGESTTSYIRDYENLMGRVNNVNKRINRIGKLIQFINGLKTVSVGDSLEMKKILLNMQSNKVRYEAENTGIFNEAFQAKYKQNLEKIEEYEVTIQSLDDCLQDMAPAMKGVRSSGDIMKLVNDGKFPEFRPDNENSAYTPSYIQKILGELEKMSRGEEHELTSGYKELTRKYGLRNAVQEIYGDLGAV